MVAPSEKASAVPVAFDAASRPDSGSGEVVVEGRQVVASARRAGEVVRRIDRDELVRAGSLGQALAREPGVQIRQSGGLGSWTQMLVRGAPASQTQVFLDGVPLSGSAGSTVDLGPIPVEGLEWIELRQAGDAGAFGAPRLDLRSRSGWTRIGASARQGSFGEQGLSFFGGDPAGLATVSAWYERASNDYPFAWDNGTVYNTSDDHVVRLGNNNYRGMGVAAGWRPTESIQILSRWESTEKGVTSPSNPDPDARFGKNAFQASAAWEATAGWHRHAEIGGRWFASDWNDPQRSADYAVVPGMRETGRDVQGSFGVERIEAAWFRPEGGASARWEASERRATGGAHSHPDGERVSFEGRLGLKMGPPEGAWGVEAASRAGWKRDDRDFTDRMSKSIDTAAVAKGWTSGTGNLRLWFKPTASVTTWIATEVAQRVPDFSEWMGDNGFVLPNLDLRPERAWGSETAVMWRRAAWAAKFAAWSRFYERPIAMVSRGSGPLGIYQNGPDNRFFGFDADASYCRAWGWVRGTATLQNARQSDPNPALDGNWPRWTPALQGHLEAGARPRDWLGMGYTLDSRGEVFADEFNSSSSRRPARILHGMWISGSWASVRLTLSVANLSDEPARDWEYLPLAGRRFLAKIDWNLASTKHEGEPSP